MKGALLVVCLVAVAAAAPEKRLVLDTIVGEQQKFIECEMKHSKPECDQCCKSTQWNYPGEEMGCLGTCYALPMTAPSGPQKRLVLDTIAQEQQKFIECETKHSKPECDQCCKSTQWNYPGEEIGCLGTCYALPMTGPQKRLVLDTIAQEQQKFIECETKHSKPECDQCCKSTQWNYPGEEIGCLGTCYALPMTAPSGPQKRLVLDTIAQEQQKFIECETKHSKPECDQCCKSTQWNYPGEEIGCLGTCYALPMTGPQKRLVLDTIAQAAGKGAGPDHHHSDSSLHCCKSTQWNYPGEEIGCLGTCYALPMTGPSGTQKRFVLDTIAQEQQKFVECESKATKAECDQCCRSTSWPYPAEDIGCLAGCFALPLMGGTAANAEGQL
ncbi:uncharacterized protein LOC143297701 [Babylonia areolata]|uniref:uncharacterized protein LOC143297701 n=1 Tax=Babylonia areolata TaxID=304850 RepID=UPI003FD6179B